MIVPMHVVIFEDPGFAGLTPLTLSRPAMALLAGASTLLDKQVRTLRPSRLSLWVRPELAQVCQNELAPALPLPVTVNQPLNDEPTLLVNARLLLAGPVAALSQPVADVDDDGQLRLALVRQPGLSHDDALRHSEAWQRLGDLPRLPAQGRLVRAPWDLIAWNEQILADDFARIFRPATPLPSGPYHLMVPEAIALGHNVTLAPGCVLDASKGPIVLADDVVVGANCVIEGPCFLGPHVVVRPLTLIRPGCSFGPYCKIGGEISNTLILGYSNKGHDGFLGDSYLGQWVNLGAGTITSNLKNTYGPITLNIGPRKVPTGRTFLALSSATTPKPPSAPA